MLRARTRRTTDSTGVNLSVTHGLGAVPDFWAVEDVGPRGVGQTFFVPGTILTNVLNINNALESTCTVDVFTINYQGRLY